MGVRSQNEAEAFKNELHRRKEGLDVREVRVFYTHIRTCHVPIGNFIDSVVASSTRTQRQAIILNVIILLRPPDDDRYQALTHPRLKPTVSHFVHVLSS